MKSPTYLIPFLVLLGMACGASSGENDSYVYVTESFKNRPDTLYAHDDLCIGFHTKQFDPAIITPSVLTGNQLARQLRDATGLVWNKQSMEDGYLNLGHLYPDLTNSVVYVTESIVVDSTADYVLSTGSDDGMSIWVNGTHSKTIHRGRGISADDDLTYVRLDKGVNVLLFKIDQGYGQWGFYRQLLSSQEGTKIDSAHTIESFTDPLDAHIVDDTARKIIFKPATFLDELGSYNPRVSISASNLLHEKVDDHIIDAHDWPSTFSLPRLSQEGLDVTISVREPSTDALIYQESLPVFSRRLADSLAHELTQAEADSPTMAVRQDAVAEMFGLDSTNHPTPPPEYSTRMRAHALSDLYRYTYDRDNFHLYAGPQSWGYEDANDNSLHPFRVYIPENSGCSHSGCDHDLPVMILFAIGHENIFWRGKGHSHALMTRFVNLSTEYETLTILPHGRGPDYLTPSALGEVPLIWNQLARYFPLDSTRSTVLAWSYKTLAALKALSSHPFPATRLALIGPSLRDREVWSDDLLEGIRRHNPQLNVHIYHGELDEATTPATVMKWMRLLESKDLDVTYTELPNSDHHNYVHDPLPSIYAMTAGTEPRD